MIGIFITYTTDQLNQIEVANPSEVVMGKIGVQGVAESSAALAANSNKWIAEKTKKHSFIGQEIYLCT